MCFSAFTHRSLSNAHQSLTTCGLNAHFKIQNRRASDTLGSWKNLKVFPVSSSSNKSIPCRPTTTGYIEHYNATRTDPHPVYHNQIYRVFKPSHSPGTVFNSSDENAVKLLLYLRGIEIGNKNL